MSSWSLNSLFLCWGPKRYIFIGSNKDEVHYIGNLKALMFGNFGTFHCYTNSNTYFYFDEIQSEGYM